MPINKEVGRKRLVEAADTRNRLAAQKRLTGAEWGDEGRKRPIVVPCVFVSAGLTACFIIGGVVYLLAQTPR